MGAPSYSPTYFRPPYRYPQKREPILIERLPEPSRGISLGQDGKICIDDFVAHLNDVQCAAVEKRFSAFIPCPRGMHLGQFGG